LVDDDLGMVRDGVFSDDFWAVVEPVLPSSSGRRGRPWNDHRRTLEGIAWRYRTGTPWRDLPVEFGAWQTVWERHFRWSQDGTYQRIFDAVRSAGMLAPSGDDDLERLLSIDSTVVRAHQHAAGARKLVVEEGAVLPDGDTGGTAELHAFAVGAG
jgi:transposase